MHHGRRYSTLYLTGRSLLPSPLSAALAICTSIGIILVHFLLISIALGTIFPNFWDGEWGLFYTNTIVQPLATISSNLTFGNIVIIGAWGLCGLAVYFVFEFVAGRIKDFYQDETNVQMAGPNVVRHPALASFFTTLFWRLGVLAMAILVLVVAQPFLRRLFVGDELLLSGELSLAASVRKLAFELVGWALVVHSVVVFLRLFLMRTRLLGDLEIE